MKPVLGRSYKNALTRSFIDGEYGIGTEKYEFLLFPIVMLLWLESVLRMYLFSLYLHHQIMMRNTYREYE
ncbi:hypothetical protein DWW83_01620 [Bacteroides uniformis]|uniref:Uncharacterized protein n=2 Tax=Bacteroides uniformis TaxID=820 RepID=A0A412SUU0_BACUN|nr:hypothetical protein BACUNI_03059 [Bacteroides uniformis ATCC 8492]RGN80057.1 hypothetical protein DXB40_19105 [Bacteroides sp. 4_1_36]RGU41420.1 hypothetical protein DWW83_01620 [Bacteroides uniformis]RJV55196.1 hypothetical protein DWW72_17190 [Bacteroides sp. AF16-7]RJW89624.1 hypothetical protein DWZ90_09235 [Bacteroides sp. AF36-11BH]RJW90075.1 hypothetical protein DWZ80_12955 [Bacteroides sp. AF35-22]